MRFEEALKIMKDGNKVKLPSWGGFWKWDSEKESIIMHTKDGEELDIRETQVVEYTLGNKAVAFVGTSGVQMGWLASQADMLAEDWVFA